MHSVGADLVSALMDAPIDTLSNNKRADIGSAPAQT
jgi:hypothetical protein